MQFYLEHFAVAVCAITGVLAARGKKLDLVGVIVLALVTALGGGTLRDLTLGVRPVFWIDDPRYVLTAASVAILTFVVARFWEMPYQLLLVADAFGLALFTWIGTEKSLTAGVSGTIAIVMGVMTGVAGGIMRDLLSGEIPLVFRKEIYLYATAAFTGALAFVLLQRYLPGQSTNRFVGMGTTFIMRLAAIQWRLQLPIFEVKEKT
jgi:uncharacterized membrane protein YeiH